MAGGAAGVALGGLLAAGTGHTYARLSDYQVISNNRATAAVWQPDPPAACGPISNYASVVYGTAGNDVIHGGNHPQIIMGLGGDDSLYAGNSGDCLVGGDGNDKLYGDNGTDILIGGDGNDYLDGGNGKDDLDGGPGTGDVCIGGNGHDTYTGCEVEE